MRDVLVLTANRRRRAGLCICVGTKAMASASIEPSTNKTGGGYSSGAAKPQGAAAPRAAKEMARGRAWTGLISISGVQGLAEDH